MIYDESKMCFMTVANRPYQKYVPWFLYFLNRAYPKAAKLILLDEKLDSAIKPMLSLLSGNFEIRERAFPEYEQADANTIKCLRWLTFDPAFEKYDCMSIGDVDMAIYKESPSYMEQHLSHCELLGIPYSNFIRSSLAGPRRMCGIHVVRPTEWFTAICPIIEKYRPMLKRGEIHLSKVGFNEQLLLKIIKESSLGEPPKNLSETYWQLIATSSHHGTHIRLAEQKNVAELKRTRNHEFHKEAILSAVDDIVFKRLVGLSPKIGNILVRTANAYRNL